MKVPTYQGGTKIRLVSVWSGTGRFSPLLIPLFMNAGKNSSKYTSGFWPRVRARALRAPVFLDSLRRPTGRYAPPRPSQLRCSPKNKNLLFPETKCLPSGPNSGRLGLTFFHRAKLHPTELHCI